MEYQKGKKKDLYILSRFLLKQPEWKKMFAKDATVGSQRSVGSSSSRGVGGSRDNGSGGGGGRRRGGGVKK